MTAESPTPQNLCMGTRSGPAVFQDLKRRSLQGLQLRQVLGHFEREPVVNLRVQVRVVLPQQPSSRSSVLQSLLEHLQAIHKNSAGGLPRMHAVGDQTIAD